MWEREIRAQDVEKPNYVSIESVARLPMDELKLRKAVRLEGVVAGIIRRTGRFLLQENGAGVIVVPVSMRAVPELGARVRVEGETIQNVSARVKALKVTVLDPEFGVPPSPEIDIAKARKPGTSLGGMVAVSGLIQSVTTNYPPAPSIMRNRVTVMLRRNHQVLSVVAPRPTRKLSARLRLAEVTMRGVLTKVRRVDLTVERVLWVFSWDSVDIHRDGPPDPFAQPAESLHRLQAGEVPVGAAPVRIRGRIVDVQDKNLFSLGILSDGREPTILVRQDVSRNVRPGDVVDLAGFAIKGTDGSQFEVTDLRWLGLPADVPVEEGVDSPLSNYVATVVSKGVIRNLPDEQAERGWPVRVNGTVTYRDASDRVFYLQTGFSGVRVEWKGANDLPQLREMVFVEGHAFTGSRHPHVVGRIYTLTATNEVFAHKKASAAAFVDGQVTGSRLRLSGIVRSATEFEEKDAAWLRIEWEGRTVRARVQLHGEPMPPRLVDSVVTIRGVAEARPNSRQSFPEEILLVQHMDDLKVVDPAPDDPFGAPPRKIRDVVGRSWKSTGVRRLRVAGVVTYVDKDRVYLKGDTGALKLRLGDFSAVNRGDRVTALGFPRTTSSTAMLEDVTLRRLSQGELPEPLKISPNEILEQRLLGHHVRVRGTVVGHAPARRGRLELRGDGIGFTAVMPGHLEMERVLEWKVGSMVEVTGVGQLSGNGGDPRSFRLYVTDANDVTLISGPPWWNAERAMFIMGGLLMLALAALGWAGYFRNRAAKQRSMFLTTFHASPMPSWIVRRKDLVCIEVNAEFERRFACSRDEFVGRSMKKIELWASRDEQQRFLQTIVENPSIKSMETRLQGRRGPPFNVLLSAEPLEIEGSECVLNIAYDISDRLKLLEQLRQAQKMEAVGQLAAGVAHDFNNLLTVVRGNSGLIQLDRGLDENTLMLSREIEEAGSRAAELTGQLLAYSRKSVMQRSATDLNDVARHAVKMLGRMLDERIQVCFQPAPEPLPIEADSRMLEQVLLNLGVNARDAMPNGGKLSLTSRVVEYANGDIPSNTDATAGRFAVLEVSDTGEGMPADVREHVFEPFFTTKDVGKGTGLGLSTAYGILRQHGGWIDLESEPRNGTTFILHLPVATTTPAEGDSKSRSDSMGRGSETILVVEDEAPVRQTVRRSLEHFGYTVLEAEDGPSAETTWRDHAVEVDLVLTDLVLPNGISGLDLIHRLKASRPNLKVVYMTGHSKDLLEHGSQLAAGVNFLPKPFESQQLARMIRDRLDAEQKLQ